MLQQYAAVTPKAILHLIRDIATQTEQTPTLYRPPRNKDNEYTFANNVAYFHALVTFRRQEVLPTSSGNGFRIQIVRIMSSFLRATL